MSVISISGSGGSISKVINKGSDSLTQSAINVGTSSVELHTGPVRNPNRIVVRIYNDGGTPCYIGPVTVSTSGATKGEELAPGEAMSYSVGNVALHAITARNSTVLVITEMA